MQVLQFINFHLSVYKCLTIKFKTQYGTKIDLYNLYNLFCYSHVYEKISHLNFREDNMFFKKYFYGNHFEKNDYTGLNFYMLDFVVK